MRWKVSVPKNHWTLLSSWMGLDPYYARFWDLQTIGDLRSHESWEWYMNLRKRQRAGNRTKNIPDRWRSPGREPLSLGQVLNHSLTHHPQKGRRIDRNSHPMFSGCKKKVNIDLTAPPSQPFQPFNSFLLWVEVPKQNSFRIKTQELRKNAGKSSQKCG